MLLKFSFSSEIEPGKMIIEEWKVLEHREPDWVEADVVKNHVLDQENEEDQSEFIYEEQHYLREFRLVILYGITRMVVWCYFCCLFNSLFIVWLIICYLIKSAFTRDRFHFEPFKIENGKAFRLRVT